MAQRGRKSAGERELSVVQLPGAQRPKPPAELTQEQAEVWRATVDTMPVDWFRPESHALLAAYCRHVCRARFLSRELDRFEADWLTDDDGPERYNKLSTVAERESRAALALARSMRVTHQARYDAQGAYRKHEDRPAGPRPWE